MAIVSFDYVSLKVIFKLQFAHLILLLPSFYFTALAGMRIFLVNINILSVLF